MELSSHSGDDYAFISEAARLDAKVKDDNDQMIACCRTWVLRSTRCGITYCIPVGEDKVQNLMVDNFHTVSGK